MKEILYGVVWKLSDDGYKQVCKSCGEPITKLLGLWIIPYHDYDKHVCRCKNCGRYICWCESREKDNGQEEKVPPLE